MQKVLSDQCNELNIIFYTKDSFVFKNFDTNSIKKYIELITLNHDYSVPDCKATGKLVFKHNNQELFTADFTTPERSDSTSCSGVKYQLDSKVYRHRFTYQVGMGIDQIYWHKVNPKGNPWIGFDTSKFRYEDLGDIRTQ